MPQLRVQWCSFAESHCLRSRRVHTRPLKSLEKSQERPFVVPRSVDDTERLVALSHSLQNARLRPKANVARNRLREPNEYGNWYCSGCCQWLPPSDYYPRDGVKSGLQYFCKGCDSNRLFKYKCSLRGFFKKLFQRARSKARTRALSGRPEAGSFELEDSALFDLLLRQEGRCAYSGVVLQTRPLASWQCSLERVDPSAGYIPTNVVLIAAEFQSRAQWSWQKILSLPVPQHDVIPCCMGVGCYCFCKKLLRSAKNSALRTRHGAFRKKPREFSLTLRDLQIIVSEQKGRCAYSNIALNFKSLSEWMASLERLDNSRGYIVQNVALICFEFQSADFSNVSTSERIRGSPQWSPAKASELSEWVQNPSVREWIMQQEANFEIPRLGRSEGMEARIMRA